MGNNTDKQKRKYQKREIGQRAYNTAEKQKIADTYKDVLYMINLFNNGFMLQSQLQELLLKKKRYKRKASVGDALFKLKDAGIVKEVKVYGYRSKFIVFKTFAWKYVKGKEFSFDVAGTKRIGAERYSESVFKVASFIHLLDLIEAETWEEKVNILRNQECSIFYNSSRMHEYAGEHFDKHSDNENYMIEAGRLNIAHNNDLANLKQHGEISVAPNVEEVMSMFNDIKGILTGKVTDEAMYQIMVTVEEVLSENLCGSMAMYNEKVAELKEKKELAVSLIRKISKPGLKYLTEQHVFIRSVAADEIVFSYMDYMNNQSVEGISKAYWLSEKITKDVFNVTKFSFEVFAANELAVANITRYRDEHRINPELGHKSKHTPLAAALIKRGYSTAVVGEFVHGVKIYNMNIDKYLM